MKFKTKRRPLGQIPPMSSILSCSLIVSCQAEGESPFNAPAFIIAFAKAAELGGAVGVRIGGTENVRAVKACIRLPIIGITKDVFQNGDVLITGTLEDVEALIRAGADIVALDATQRKRPNGLDGAAMISEIRKRFSVPLIADISTFEEGIESARVGADFVGTTLSGYTSDTKRQETDEPDFELIERLSSKLLGRVIAEGRIWTPEQAAEAMNRGAYAVVVETAITRPVDIVKRFVRSIEGSG